MHLTKFTVNITHSKNVRRYLIYLLLTCFCISCTLLRQHQHIARKHRLDSNFYETNGFTLQTFSNPLYKSDHATTTQTNQKKILHIYIEGDGVAWRNLHTPSIDPTPNNPIMLRLMTMDRTPAIYIGRPCYFVKNDKCQVLLWTFARYGEEVIMTLTQAIERASTAYSSVTLIGHSGGGTLAMLIAPRLEKVTQIITLAGNLDTEAWTEQHHYTPLYLSLNPAKQASLPNHIKQKHFAAENDKNVLPDFIRSVANKENGEFILLKGIDHTCCWEKVWPTILND